MKQLILAAVLALALNCVEASEYRDLTAAEESKLRAIAAESAGVGVWLTQGGVILDEARETSLVNVIFEPANVSGYCLAPSAVFKAEGQEQELQDWTLIEGGPTQYRFWYQSCDDADLQSAVVLEQFVDISVLQRLKEQQDWIIDTAIHSLAPEYEYDIPVSEHKPRRIGIRFNPDRGAIYRLQYWGTKCRGLSIDALLLPDEIGVLDSLVWVC